MARSRPYVVGHVAVSLDGATGGFQPDVATFYELARTWAEDVTLTGATRSWPRRSPSGTLLDPDRRKAGHCSRWSTAGAACGTGTPCARSATGPTWSRCAARRRRAPPHRRSTRSSWAPPGWISQAALRALGERPGVEVVRVDSGGGLLGALLGAQLVDELSLLVHPCLVGPAHQRRWHGQAVVPTMAVTGCDALDGLVWLRYRLGQEPALGVP